MNFEENSRVGGIIDFTPTRKMLRIFRPPRKVEVERVIRIKHILLSQDAEIRQRGRCQVLSYSLLNTISKCRPVEALSRMKLIA